MSLYTPLCRGARLLRGSARPSWALQQWASGERGPDARGLWTHLSRVMASPDPALRPLEWLAAGRAVGWYSGGWTDSGRGGLHVRGLAAGPNSELRAILLENVDGLGNARDVVTVKAGYLRNCLYPGKKAVYATSANLRKLGLTPDGGAPDGAPTDPGEEATLEPGPLAPAPESSALSSAEKILARLGASTVVGRAHGTSAARMVECSALGRCRQPA
eukprot:scaffold3134_cov414-Prasinococcus_capsulatus_cf.AAC.26